jgi:hypothetical protein
VTVYYRAMRQAIVAFLSVATLLFACAPSQQVKDTRVPLWIPGGQTESTEWRKWNNYFFQVTGNNVLSTVSLGSPKIKFDQPIIKVAAGPRVNLSSIGAACYVLIYKRLLEDSIVAEVTQFILFIPQKEFDFISSIADGLTKPKDIAEFSFNTELLCSEYEKPIGYGLRREQMIIPLRKNYNFRGFGDIVVSIQAPDVDLSVEFLPSGKVLLLETP